MQNISTEQLQAFKEYSDRQLVREIAESLLVTFPEETMDVDALIQEIMPVVDVARGWLITDGPLIALHVYASKVLGSDYYSEMPFAGKVMADPDLENEVKTRWLLGWLDSLRKDSQTI